MNIFKKAITITTALMLVTGLNVGLSYAASDSQKAVESVNSNDPSVFVDSIRDSETKEKISDLMDIEYLEVGIEDGDTTKAELSEWKAKLVSDQSALTDVKELAKLDDKQLDKAIDNRIQDLLDEAKENENIMILPSSYDILQKYNFSNEVKWLKETEETAMVSSNATIKSEAPKAVVAKKGAYKGWDRTATGYLRNGQKQIKATYKVNVQWFINSSKKIYYWDTNQSHSNKANTYTFISQRITSQKTQNKGKALLIAGDGKFKKKLHVPGLTPKYNHIILDIDCFNGGGFDFHASTKATYK